MSESSGLSPQAPTQTRRYHRLDPFLRDLAYVLRNLHHLRRARIGAAFRERLMLAVTAINRCRYCAYGHARLAVRAGVPEEEVQRLLQGYIHDAQPYELPALLYASHWAETDAEPDPDAVRLLHINYEPQTRAAIQTTIRTIRLGNLTGNTWDHFLCRVTRGRLGC